MGLYGEDDVVYLCVQVLPNWMSLRTTRQSPSVRLGRKVYPRGPVIACSRRPDTNGRDEVGRTNVRKGKRVEGENVFVFGN